MSSLFVFTDKRIAVRPLICFPDAAVSCFIYHPQHINIEIATSLTNVFRNWQGSPCAQLCLLPFRYLYLSYCTGVRQLPPKCANAGICPFKDAEPSVPDL